MHVVFRHQTTVYAATINEWTVDAQEAVISLNHSEFEEIEYTNFEWKVDGSAVEILEMSPDVRNYL